MECGGEVVSMVSVEVRVLVWRSVGRIVRYKSECDVMVYSG